MDTGLTTIREVTGGKIKIKAMQIGVRTCTQIHGVAVQITAGQ
jgi:hypothetical protein